MEPFAGSAILFYALQPQAAILSDLNGDLIDTLIGIRDIPDEVYAVLAGTPRGSESFYAVRKSDPATLGHAERAARFIFLNRFCFNGLYRTNSKGKFNVPFAASRTGEIPDKSSFLRSALELRKAEIRHGDFQQVLLEVVREGDFVYLDPPFAVRNRRVFRQYGPDSFGLQDLERLRTTLIEIDARGANFVLSYAWCSEASAAFSAWSHKRVYTQRNIAGFTKHRRKAAELIVSNIQVPD